MSCSKTEKVPWWRGQLAFQAAEDTLLVRPSTSKYCTSSRGLRKRLGILGALVDTVPRGPKSNQQEVARPNALEARQMWILEGEEGYLLLYLT